LAGTI